MFSAAQSLLTRVPRQRTVNGWCLRRFTARSAVPQTRDEPLRILFCGADEFSVTSLQALHTESQSSESNIQSIDVVTKTDKRVGRGLKQIRQPPLKTAALGLGLPVHQIETFTGWELPVTGDLSINLIVAVSFGLLIPARIIRGSQFGGLNVHPSLLPELRGAAPIQWTILNGLSHTGVSVQTLHPTKFDAGTVLAQTPRPGIAIPNPNTCTFSELRDYLAPLGAEMLVKTIRSRLYIPPYQSANMHNSSHPAGSLAAKITPELRIVNFQTMPGEFIIRMSRVFPRLRAFVTSNDVSQPPIHIILGQGIRQAGDTFGEEIRLLADSAEPGTPYAVVKDSEDILTCDGPLFVAAADQSTLVIPTITVAGKASGPAAAVSARSHFFRPPIANAGYKVYFFHQPLRLPPGSR